MSPRRFRACGVALAAALLALTGCTGDGTSPAADVRYLDAGKRISAYAPDARKPAPVLAGQTVDGGSFDLAAQRGKIVVINVWATWCSPCRKETPDLVSRAKALGPEGVAFVGISTRDEDANAVAFQKRYRVPYPSLSDHDGELVAAFSGTVPLSAPPSTVVIDRAGRIAGVAVGPVTEDQVTAMVEPVLAEPA